jgi:vitamin B12 transporter
MKPLLFTLLLGGLAFFINISGQWTDTVHLDAIEVKVLKSKYAPGSKITALDLEKIEQVSFGTLTGMLVKNTPIYIKSYAAGLSTISFRGTSPNHTQIYFNGESFNSFTLGHANASDIPMFFFDQVQVQYGGASSLYGTGAIGGSIHLSSLPTWVEGIKSEVHQDFASFKTSFTGLKLRVGNGKTESSTKIFYKTAQNNFKFRSKAFKDFETGEYLVQEQKNSALENYGLLQEFYFKASGSDIFSLKYYYAHNWHEVQPTMSSNLHGGSFTQIFDRNQRLIGQYSHRGKNKGLFTGQMALASDFQLYNLQDTIASKRVSAQAEYERPVGSKGTLNAGGYYVNIQPNVHSYLVDVNENRADFFVSYLHNLWQNTKVSLNLRNAMVTGYEPEWAPSAGIHHRVNVKGGQILDWKLAASRSYKIPSFNDRFWGTWGNPDLKTETGTNFETSLGFHSNGNNHDFNSELTLYSMMVDDWIQWEPVSSDMWSPKNFKKVHSRGWELSTGYSRQILKMELEMKLQYAFNLATPVKVYGNDRSELNKQMPYSPLHSALFCSQLEQGKWRFTMDVPYTGKRSNSTFDREIAGYLLLNMGSAYLFEFQKSSLDISFNMNNLLNTFYINIENYAMPGINGHLSLKFKFNQ